MRNRLLLPLRHLFFWLDRLAPWLLLAWLAILAIRGVFWAIHFDWLPHLRLQKIGAMLAAVTFEMALLFPVWRFSKRREAGWWNGFLLLLMLIPVTLGLAFVSLAWEL